MTTKQTKGLWLWAGVLTLALLTIGPLAAWIRVIADLAVLSLMAAVWLASWRSEARFCEPLILAENTTLPPDAYRQPVVLVCGDGLVGLFGDIPAQLLALRVTEHGCYVRVPDLQQLPAVAASFVAQRPHWGEQLSVMFITNPGEHTDPSVLAGRVRSLSYQIALIRQRGIALPLLLTSYLQAARDAGPWFSWHAGQPSPSVREGGGCFSLVYWQRQAADSKTRTVRLHACVHLNSGAAWLSESVLPRLATPLACAITLVPELPQALVGNLWQQWLRDKVALVEVRPPGIGPVAQLPFPDSLLHLLAARTQCHPAGRTQMVALWLFAVAGVIALASSAWQNTLLARQVSDDLRRYSSIATPENRDQPEFALREQALAVLRQDAQRLDSYFRLGEPLALGLGLYRGERLRLPLLNAISGHRQPLAAPRPSATRKTVRLNSLSLFNTGSAELKTDSAKVLINALVDIKAQPGWLIVIAGHTDATGNTEQNIQLSRARAAAVHGWMQRMGDIPDSCFAVQGFGASQPIASNETEHGRAANRRVDIRLVPEVGACVLSPMESDLQPQPHSAAFKH